MLLVMFCPVTARQRRRTWDAARAQLAVQPWPSRPPLQVLIPPPPLRETLPPVMDLPLSWLQSVSFPFLHAFILWSGSHFTGSLVFIIHKNQVSPFPWMYTTDWLTNCKIAVLSAVHSVIITRLLVGLQRVRNYYLVLLKELAFQKHVLSER